MKRRHFFQVFATFSLALRAGAASTSLRGRLKAGPAPMMETSSQVISLTGDEDTKGVLGDGRLDGSDFEVMGHITDPAHFEVDKIHTRSLFVIKGGKRMMVTYWCDVCYIRTYTPGKCWCCQKDTDLDLRETLPGE